MIIRAFYSLINFNDFPVFNHIDLACACAHGVKVITMRRWIWIFYVFDFYLTRTVPIRRSFSIQLLFFFLAKKFVYFSEGFHLFVDFSSFVYTFRKDRSFWIIERLQAEVHRIYSYRVRIYIKSETICSKCQLIWTQWSPLWVKSSWKNLNKLALVFRLAAHIIYLCLCFPASCKI